MSLQTNIKNLRSERGFTIVELLIVIVVIAILAAITIVAFNGVTARANTSSAQAAASTVIKKVEAYQAEESTYPAGFATISAPAGSGKSWQVTGVNQATITAGTKPAGGPNTVEYIPCPETGTPVTGARVSYYKYEDNTKVTLTTGVCS